MAVFFFLFSFFGSVFVGAILIQGLDRLKKLATHQSQVDDPERPAHHFHGGNTSDSMTESIPWPSTRTSVNAYGFSPLPWPSKLHGTVKDINVHRPSPSAAVPETDMSEQFEFTGLVEDESFFNQQDLAASAPSQAAGPAPRQLDQWRHDLGLSGTIDQIRQHTGWSFKDAANYLVEYSDSQSTPYA